jgi:hypothetical protein
MLMDLKQNQHTAALYATHLLRKGTDRAFALDLLFFHRCLNALVAIELKVGRFEPEYLGKLNFYLEALDRDVRKAHE